MQQAFNLDLYLLMAYFLSLLKLICLTVCSLVLISGSVNTVFIVDIIAYHFEPFTAFP